MTCDCTDIFPKSAEINGAAKTGKGRRINLRLKWTWGVSVKMVPFVPEQFGQWNCKSSEYLQSLSKKSVDEVGCPNPKNGYEILEEEICSSA